MPVESVQYRATVRAIEGLEHRLDEASRQFVAESTAYVTRIAMKNASTGEHPPGQPHIPGTGPGPNVARGNLRRSIHPTPMRRSVHGWEGEAKADVIYARAIELGHPRWPEGLKFPFFQPAVESWRRRASTLAKDIFGRAVHR